MLQLSSVRRSEHAELVGLLRLAERHWHRCHPLQRKQSMMMALRVMIAHERTHTLHIPYMFACTTCKHQGCAVQTYVQVPFGYCASAS